LKRYFPDLFYREILKYGSDVHLTQNAYFPSQKQGDLKLKVGFAPKAIQPSVALEASRAFSLISSSAFSSF